MEKGKIRFLVFLITILGLFSVLVGVLFVEEGKRLTRADQARQEFLAEQQAIERDRQQYFDALNAKRSTLQTGMDAARQSYEKQVADQPAAIANQQTTKTTMVTVPVQTPVTTQVTTPKPARKTKTS